MKLHETLNKFEKLANTILEDGKVDFAETDVLLDFIQPYVIADDKKFVNFKKLVLKCREDGKITNEESSELVREIKKIMKFLKFENAVFIAFVVVVGSIVAYSMIAALVHYATRYL